MIRALALTLSLAGCSILATPGFKPEFAPGSDPCVRFTATSIVDFAVGAAAAVVPFVATPAPPANGGPDFSAASMGAGFGAMAIVDGISGLVGVYEHSTCRTAERELHERETAAAAAKHLREQAWQLTQEAETAARADDCARARELGFRIAMLDPEMHDTVFGRDVAVQRCMASP